MSLDTHVLIIGAGVSGLGFAVQLVRQYKARSFEIIEKSDNIGGTWWVNSYPGCGCDVPSHFYSFSFALNPNWSRVFSMRTEIHEYLTNVADHYNLILHVRLQSSVVSARWETKSATWLVEIKDHSTQRVHARRCKILISAVGALSVPKDCDIPGAADFRGKLFHSARWDHSFDWKGKRVVVVGNGCSATQFVPIISAGTQAAGKVTQFSRQAHWLVERSNPHYSTLFRWAMNWIPGAMRLYRALLYYQKEADFRGFKIQSGAKIRDDWTRAATSYIETKAPAKYKNALVPRTVVGCKRRVIDTGYLDCLHRDNVELVHDDPIAMITETGVQTNSGRTVDADAIILATGFETQKFLFPMEIHGENGISLDDHWRQMSQGTPSAYFGTCFAGFPNLFVMMGPNTITGHLSVIYTVECQINFTLRVIQPIVRSLEHQQALLPRLHPSWDYVVVNAVAQKEYNDWIQKRAKEFVWSTGCTSWFINTHTGRNTQIYPDWQFLFWLRSAWIRWRDFSYGNGLARD